jgi:hypothetical protein
MYLCDSTLARYMQRNLLPGLLYLLAASIAILAHLVCDKLQLLTSIIV